MPATEFATPYSACIADAPDSTADTSALYAAIFAALVAEISYNPGGTTAAAAAACAVCPAA